MLPNGKWIMLWRGKNFRDGSIAAAVAACKAMGLSCVAMKIGDGINDRDYASYPGQMPQAVAAFRAAGIDVVGWHYIYGGVWYKKSTGEWLTNGATPAQEAAFAKAQVKALGLSAYLIDAEKEYKLLSQASRAKSFMANLAGIGVPVGLCSYRFPTVHPTFPWEEFLVGCDFHAPQVYHGSGRGVPDLVRSQLELEKLRKLPIVPVGRAYIGDGYAAPGITPAEMLTFMDAAKQACLGVSFWALDFLHLHDGGAARQEAIGLFDWQGSSLAPDPAPVESQKVIGKLRITASVLNVRKGPSAGYADVGDTMRGSEWYVFEKSNGWARIGASTWIKVDGFAEWIES